MSEEDEYINYTDNIDDVIASTVEVGSRVGMNIFCDSFLKQIQYVTSD